MNPVIWSIAIAAGGLILNILYQIWARANTQGADKQSTLQLSGQVAKLIEWRDEGTKFQAGVLYFMETQKAWNGRTEARVDEVTNRQNQMQGREDVRREGR